MTQKFAIFVCAPLILAAYGCASSGDVQDEPEEFETLSTQSNVPMDAARAPQTAELTNKKNADCKGDGFADNGFYYDINGDKTPSAKLNATGFGAPPKAFYPEPQRRLMAMRAAKIDAYRTLAERVYGMKIWGGTTVGDMVVEKDRFKVYLNTHLQGARVVSENAMEDGTFETMVEIELDQSILKAGLANIDPCNKKTDPVRRMTNAGDSYSDLTFPVRDDREELDSISNFYYHSEK